MRGEAVNMIELCQEIQGWVPNKFPCAENRVPWNLKMPSQELTRITK